MASISKLSLRGIRAFSPDDEERTYLSFIGRAPQKLQQHTLTRHAFFVKKTQSALNFIFLVRSLWASKFEFVY
jgi:hypothetical protein